MMTHIDRVSDEGQVAESGQNGEAFHCRLQMSNLVVGEIK